MELDLREAPSSPAVALSRRGIAHRPPLRGGRRFSIVHLDGVSRDTLALALARGHMPFLQTLLERGELVQAATFAGVPASTPVFQAGLFYGVRPDVPGFLWHDKRRGVDVRMDDPAAALALEETLAASGPGLLVGGSTYFSIVSGGAGAPAFCTSRLARELTLGGIDRKNGYDHAASWVAHSVAAARSLARVAEVAVSGTWSSARWSLQQGRAKHEPRFLLNRMLLAEIGLEVTTQLTLLDIARGVPAIYSVYAGYDELAHRRGPHHDEALEELGRADDALRSIHEAIAARPELHYELYVLSDHGQVETQPCESVLHGPNLADWILAADASGSVDPTRVHHLARERIYRERIDAVPFLHAEIGCTGRASEGGGESSRPPLVVSDAGDLAHVYFTDSSEPLTLELLSARYRAQLRAAIDCPASGIVAVRGGERGFAFHRGRRIDLSAPDALRGVVDYDPALAARYITGLLELPSAGDIVVLGAGCEHRDVAYAWEFGSHGGVGRGDVETFVLHPWHVPFEGKDIFDPVDLHRFFSKRFRDADGIA